jgi:DNA-binding winged helix-turn-helix (wHTH) protein/TolB-like protein
MSVTEMSNQYLFSGFRLDISSRKLFCPENKVVNLSSRAFEVLLLLVNQRGETLSKNMLMESVWPDVVVEDNNLSQAISSLRKVLNDPRSESRIIQTVPGRGYCFVARVETLANTPAEPAPTDNLDPSNSTQPAIPASFQPDSSAFLSRPNAALAIVVISALLFASVYYMSKSGDNDAGVNSVASDLSVSPDTPEASYIRDSIAVLPFTELNSEVANGIFAVGLHDEVINQLSKVSSLQVMSRSSVLTITSQYEAIDEIARLLQVESVMTGTILFIDDKARVNLQLLNPRTGVTLWSTTYEAVSLNLSEMLSIQSDIALNVVDALKAEINQYEQDEIGTLPTTSFEAYRFNLAGRNAYYQLNYQSALDLSKQAIELDPDYYDALFLYSNVNAVLMGTPLKGMTPEIHAQLALETAEHMIAIAPEKPEGYILKTIPLAAKKDWDGLSIELDRLSRMGVELSDLNLVAPILMSLGDFDGALKILEANLQKDPINLFGRGFLMAAYESHGQRSLARREYELGEKLSPFWWGDTINVFLAMGRNEPITGVDQIFGIPADLQNTLLNIGDHEVVDSGLKRYLARKDKIPAESLYYAAIAAHTGRHDVALTLMSESLDQVGFNFFYFWLPVFDEARKQEGFREILIDSGIVKYWDHHGWQDVCQTEGESFSCDWQAYP